jgi:MinD-like ATPase involved in chromosome partitioning or flagellar assembly
VYLGLEDVSIGFTEVIHGKSTITSAAVPHPASGLRVLLQRVDVDIDELSQKELESFEDKVKKTDYQFIIVDTEPGIQYEKTIKWYDEALLITTPYEASCISTIKLMRKYGKASVKMSLIVNRIENKKHELTIREIEDLCVLKVSGILPEDENVKVGVSSHIPVYLLNKKSPFSKGIDDMARMLISRTGEFGRVHGDDNGGFLSGVKKKFGK